MRSHLYIKFRNKPGYFKERIPEWAILQVYGILPWPVLGYVKKGAQLWCTLLLYNDFVLQIRGFKFSYLENVRNEGITIVEYISPHMRYVVYTRRIW